MCVCVRAIFYHKLYYFNGFLCVRAHVFVCVFGCWLFWLFFLCSFTIHFQSLNFIYSFVYCYWQTVETSIIQNIPIFFWIPKVFRKTLMKILKSFEFITHTQKNSFTHLVLHTYACHQLNVKTIHIDDNKCLKIFMNRLFSLISMIFFLDSNSS